MATTELLSRQAAAEWLTQQIPDKSTEQWALWLRNNANAARRASYRIPTEQIGRGTFYNLDELTKFVEWEKSRQLGSIKLTGRAAEVARAFGIGSATGSTTGRKLHVTGINPQVDEATGKPFIQFITDDPLMVYRLELDAARLMATELLDAVAACERAQQ